MAIATGIQPAHREPVRPAQVFCSPVSSERIKQTQPQKKHKHRKNHKTTLTHRKRNQLKHPKPNDPNRKPSIRFLDLLKSFLFVFHLPLPCSYILYSSSPLSIVLFRPSVNKLCVMCVCGMYIYVNVTHKRTRDTTYNPFPPAFPAPSTEHSFPLMCCDVIVVVMISVSLFLLLE